MGIESNTISFKPLAGSRFRVIIWEEGGKKKFGPRLNKGQTKRFRGAFENQRLHRLQPTLGSQSVSESDLRRAKISWGQVMCPFCFTQIVRMFSGKQVCPNRSCRKEFIAYRE